MCGIAGILNIDSGLPPPERELLSRMISTLRHRGPDGFGLYRDDRTGLAHARLSIIDLSTGDQPMSNEDRSLWITFNGEIFNYVELRKELEPKGHVFRTRSDTEVILHAFEEWGTACFGRFNGQWALALWDVKSGTLTLSRDRVGVRPLYTERSGGRLRFASEVKSLFADRAVPRELEPLGISEVFTYWTTLAPRTVFKGIEEIPPATFRQYIAGGKVKEAKYWEPVFSWSANESGRASVDETAAELRSRLLEATSLRMLRADVPVGSYLSGGLDSSVVATLGRRAQGKQFKTFSICFADSEFDESRYQRLVAQAIGTEHSEITVSRSDIADAFEDVVFHAERPILRTAPVPMYLLSSAVHDSGIKCVLTGEGADEFFAGYDIFKEAKIRWFWSQNPGSVSRPRLFDRLYPYLARSPRQARGLGLQFWREGIDDTSSHSFTHETRWRNGRSAARFFSKETREYLSDTTGAGTPFKVPHGFESWDVLDRSQHLEIISLLSGYLLSSQGDRMLMANSVEGRFPFLDSNVMDFALRLPPHFRMSGLNEKTLLKRAMRGIVPDQILGRTKQPYRAPDVVSFFGPKEDRPIAGRFESIESGLFDPQRTSSLFEKCREAVSGGSADGLSNADNMAFLGILSCEIVHSRLVRSVTQSESELRFSVMIDRSAGKPFSH